jgi:hypothetical protein
MQEKIQVYAVVRVDPQYTALKDAVTVKEILPTLDEALLEVQRLNELNKDKGAEYFAQTTRYLPSGRMVS